MMASSEQEDGFQPRKASGSGPKRSGSTARRGHCRHRDALPAGHRKRLGVYFNGNLGGGYHPAAPNRGGGFCAYADIPLALLTLKEEGKLRSALAVDTHAHQGDGTADALRGWPWAHILDLYEQDIFAWPQVSEDRSEPLAPWTNGVEYLDAVREHLPFALVRNRPDLVVYNAGSDILWSDPLAALFLTVDDMAERDLYVVTEMRERGVPLGMVLSGGYGPVSWQVHAGSLEGILARFERSH